MQERLKLALERFGVAAEKGDWARISNLISAHGNENRKPNYVLQVAMGRTKNPQVFDFILTYFEEKAAMYKKLVGILNALS